MGEIIGQIFQELDKETVPDRGTTEVFVMLTAKQFGIVYNWLDENSKRPRAATKIWVLLIEHFLPHTGQISLTIKEISEKTGIHVNNVSAVMSELAEFGAIFKKKEGRRVFFYMNPHVAQFGSRATAEKLASIPKPGAALRAIEGGKK